MKKSLLLLSTFALLATAVSAQSFKSFDFEGGLNRASSSIVAPKLMKVAPQKADLAANQRLVGLYTSDNYTSSGGGLGLTSAPGELRVASIWPASVLKEYEGSTLTSIRFALANGCKVSRVFILPVDAEGNLGDELAAGTVSASTSPAGWNTVKLTTPWTVNVGTNSAFLVGFYYTQGSTNVASSFPLSLVKEGETQYVYVYGNLGQGEGWYNLGADNGNLSVQGIVESDNFAADAVKPTDFGKFTVALNSSKNVNVTFFNAGSSLKNFDYTITLDGKTSAEQHYTLDKPLAVGGSVVTSIPFAAAEKTGTYETTLTVTKVNGKTNGASTVSAKGTNVTLAKVLKRVSVVEELTGIQCGWCPRGLVGMEKLAKKFGGQFIGVGIHSYIPQNGTSTDAMFPTNEPNLGFTGAPACLINRNGNPIDPYFGSSDSGIEGDFAASLNELPVVGVNVKSAWNADSTSVTATANVESLVNGTYEVAYYLVADGVTQNAKHTVIEKRGFAQTNYYASAYGSQTGYTKQILQQQLPDLAFLWDAGAAYYPVFNDVMIASSYVGSTNKAGTVKLTEGNTTAAAAYEMNMPTTSALTKAIDKKKVYAVALVIDQESGEIVNAAKALVGEETTGIENVNTGKTTATEVSRYTVDGRKVNGPVKGLNIVKMSDGTTYKVVVK